ncbi:UNVERIFIED_CONTAM: hypothetical protein GTU68_009469 [Idotea baltica]|nr:hypothetical protein [Idotea baltica]
MNSPSKISAKQSGSDQNEDKSAESIVDFGFSAVKAEEKSGKVAEVFASVAGKYDLMNDVMSGGLHRLWKDAMVAWLNPGNGSRAYQHLDVAGGTGDIAFRVVKAGGRSTNSLVLDINPAMIANGRTRPDASASDYQTKLNLPVGDAEVLPLPDRSG